MNPIISLRHVSKTFDMSAAQSQERTFRDFLTLRAKPIGNTTNKKIVLDDVSFDIHAGECVSIVGRNGAGKSTLLKLISRIYLPDVGEIEVNGRIASLLELGTGFSPELTGQENVYFYGALMGFRKHQVDAMYEEIVEFADIGEYIHHQLKYYSSGMYQRLAFASAFAVSPEILIADEGLSVGDAQFQVKCLRRIDGLVRDGATLLLVSHQTSLVERITNRTLWLENGKIKMDDSTAVVLKEYARTSVPAKKIQPIESTQSKQSTANDVVGALDVQKNMTVQFVQESNLNPVTTKLWDCAEQLHVDFEVTVEHSETVACMYMQLITSEKDIVVVESNPTTATPHTLPRGKHQFRISIPALNLRPATYKLVVWLLNETITTVYGMSSPMMIHVVNSAYMTTQVPHGYLVDNRMYIELIQ